MRKNRKSIRLKEYDYGSEGWYFVTVCVAGMRCLFGDVVSDLKNHGNENNGKNKGRGMNKGRDKSRPYIALNDIGIIVEKNWQNVPKHFNNIELDECSIMPNHMHGIIKCVGASIYGARENNNGNRNHIANNSINSNINQGAINRAHTKGGFAGNHNPMGKKSLGEIIRWFKGRSTFDINKRENIKFKWHRNYYEHIICTEKDLQRIRTYIRNNPTNWQYDEYNLHKSNPCGLDSSSPKDSGMP